MAKHKEGWFIAKLTYLSSKKKGRPRK